jgi:hypothetical protein
MGTPLLYVDLKSGYNDNGPAWIGFGTRSRSGRTIYFNDRAFHAGGGVRGNYHDVETGEEYWISGVKRDQTDRHWAGAGVVMIDAAAVAEYLALVGKSALDAHRHQVVKFNEGDVRSRVARLLNEKL